MLFLDTNVVSEIRLISSGKANLHFTEWVKQMDTHHCWTSAVVLMELERGILRMERKDPVQGNHLRYWFNTTVRSLFENRILKIDKTTAQICAKLHIPDKRPEMMLGLLRLVFNTICRWLLVMWQIFKI